jgi:hypothetical protein
MRQVTCFLMVMVLLSRWCSQVSAGQYYSWSNMEGAGWYQVNPYGGPETNFTTVSASLSVYYDPTKLDPPDSYIAVSSGFPGIATTVGSVGLVLEPGGMIFQGQDRYGTMVTVVFHDNNPL